jgi:outer membrane protein OmpA-like peptidoglycan-associated protein
MKKPFIFFFLIIFFSFHSFSQIRVAILGGPHLSKVAEENNLPGWDSLKSNFSARTGVHFGFLADLPFKPASKLSFQPAVVFYTKGRKYAQVFDTSTSNISNKTSTQYINYVDVPANLVFKTGKKIKFLVGAGPYVSFFYNGKESALTFYKNGTIESSENNDPPVGNKPGQYKVFGLGVNALAGFEMGRFFLTANYSQGLNDFYTPVNYTATDYRHQVYGVTFGIYLGKPVEIEKKAKDKDKDGIPDESDNCPNEAGPAATFGCPDKDGDGVADKDDKCPDLAGSLANNGCPVLDSDNDGVFDNEDNCPLIAGTKKYNGCPVPDTDKDGVNDEEDVCPTIPGFGRYAGCPVPDIDGDGVDDEKDRCPNVKGTKEKNGCPEIAEEIVEKVNLAARRIQFTKYKAELLPDSKKVLDEIAEILEENEDLKLTIEGHTSNDGNYAANMQLSLARAETVKFYLQSKGIEPERLSAKGFGPTQPLNNGKTEAEKSQNRRVELKLSN